MWQKMKAGMAALKAGNEAVSAVMLKRGQMAGSLAVFITSLVALAKAFGVEVPIDEQQAITLGGAVGVLFGVYNHFATAASTSRIDALGREQPRLAAVDLAEGDPRAAVGVAVIDGHYKGERVGGFVGEPTGGEPRVVVERPAREPLRVVGESGNGGGGKPQDFTGDSNIG